MKYVLLKSVFATALMLGGANAAQADTKTIYEKGTSGHAWKGADCNGTSQDSWKCTVSGNSNITAEIADGMLKMSCAASSSDKTVAFDYTKDVATTSSTSLLTLDAVWHYANHRAGNSSAPHWNHFQIGDVDIRYSGKLYTFAVYINGAKVAEEATGAEYADGTLVIGMTVNQATKIVECNLTVKKEEMDDYVFTAKGETAADYNAAATLTMGLMNSGSSASFSHSLASIVITETTQDVSECSYTVNYQLGGATVKTVTGTGAVGGNMPVLSTAQAFEGEGDYSGQKFFIVDTKAPVQTITANAAENVLNIPVRKPYAVSFTVTRLFDGVAEETPLINDSTLVETDNRDNTWAYAFPLCVQQDGKWYMATLIDDLYGETGTFTDEPIQKTITYTSDASIINFWDYDHRNVVNNINYSGGSKNDYIKGEELGTLPAGNYELTVMQDDNYSASLYENFVDADDPGYEVAALYYGNRTVNFTLESETWGMQVWTGSNGRYDFILLRDADKIQTGIKTMETVRQQSDAQIYTLSGQRVTKTAKPGLYIVGNKKVIVK